MARTGNTPVEQLTTLHDDLPFLESQDVAAGASATKDNWAYRLEGPDGYVVFVTAGTPVSPAFRDANGDKLDDDSRILLQKCDKQGYPLGDAMPLNELLGRYNYAKMRNDPEFMRKTVTDLMVAPREIAKIFVTTPSSATGFNAAESRLTVGDETSDFGQPVEIIDKDRLGPNEKAAVQSASQRGGD